MHSLPVMMNPFEGKPALPLPAAGHGGLEVNVVAGQSAVTSAWASSPLKVLTPRSRGQSVWAYLSSFGGGMVAGDETHLSVSLGPESRCFLSTQASTKVYRNPRQLACSHNLKANLGEGSVLVLAPEPLQCFAGSAYTQRQEFQLHPRASLALVDWLSSGRAAAGERWSFRRFQSRNEVFLGTERILLDSVLLDPDDGSLDGPHRLGRFNCLALLVLVGEGLQEAATAMLGATASHPVTRRAPLLCTASPIAGGALLRLAGERVEDVARALRSHLGFLPNLLGDDPLTRKW